MTKSFVLLVASACAVTAQITPAPLRCTTTAGVPPIVRAEGRAEFVGDLLVECTDGVPGTMAGTLQLTLNTAITSRRIGDKTEALLLVNEPGLRRLNGPPTPTTFGVTVFQGVATGTNQVSFPNLVLTVPGPDNRLILRITNVRVDASALGVSATLIPTQIVATLGFLPGSAFPNLNPQVTVGYVQYGLEAETAGARRALPICESNNVPLLTPGATSGTVDMVLRFKEGFQTAFKVRRLSEGPRLPGEVFNDESGLFNETFPATDGANQAGVPTNATQLKATFTNVPPGVALYVTTASLASGIGKARMLNAAGTIAPVPLINGSGSAVWEVEESTAQQLEHIDFGVLIGYRANTVQLGAIDVQFSLAPNVETAFPNFSPTITRSAKIPFYTCGAGLPDLSLEPSRVAGYEVTTGTALRPTLTIRNQGVTAAGAFDYVAELVMAQGVFSSVRGRVPGGIAANSSVSVHPVIPVPAWRPPTVHNLRVRVDANNEITEAREDNNEDSVPTLLRCGQRLGTSSFVVLPAGGNYSPPIETGCAYSVSTDTPWITISNRVLSIEPNTSGSTRQGSITIDGQMTIPVVQAYSHPSCGFTLNAHPVEIPEIGNVRTLTLTSSGPACEWRYASNNWMQINPGAGTGSAQVQLTVFPNFAATPRYGELVVGDASVTFAQRASTGSEDRRLVQQIYFNFFGRMPSEPEIALQEGELARGVTRAELIERFMSTPEFNNGGRFIAGLYVGLLGRDAEYGGWLFQRNALSTNVVTQTQLVKNFLETREWQLTFGSPTDAEFVKLLYRNVLLREGTPPEIAFHEGTLRSGMLTRVALATNFLNTAEFRIGTGSRLTAFLLYATMLYRDARSTEFDAMRHSLSSGASVRSRLELMTNSSEFLRLLE